MIGILDTLVRTLHRIAHPTYRRILVGAHIYDIIVTLVLHGAWVKSLDSLVRCHKIVARTSLITQAPYHD